MKLLLTSGGITNDGLLGALTDLLGKPVSDADALFVPTAIYPYPGGGRNAMAAARGEASSPLCNLGWRSLGLLELSTLPSLPPEAWIPSLEEADAILVWGGNVLYLSYWLRTSGLAELLPRLDNLVYVGVSAGSIALGQLNCDFEWNRANFGPDSPVTSVEDRGTGLVPFSLWVHIDNPNPIFADHTMGNARDWARDNAAPTYAIDDHTAIRVDGDSVTVVSEGQWEYFNGAE